MFKKIVAIEPVNLVLEAEEELRRYAGEVKIYEDIPGDDQEIIRRIGDADSVLVSYTSRISAHVIESCPSIRYIGMCCSLYSEAVSYTHLDVYKRQAHGVYSGIPKLDIVRLTKIQREVAVPLVLHGASGLKDQDIQNCISHGICKVNFATELRIAYSNAAKNTFNKTPDVFDPKKYGAVGREEVKAQVKSRMRVCGCCGKG